MSKASEELPAPSEFLIERLQKDGPDGSDFVWIHFPRTNGRPDGYLVDQLSVTSTPKKLLNKLEDAGADLPKGKERLTLIVDLIDRLPQEVGTLTNSTGWKDTGDSRSFILPNDTFGDPTKRIVLTDAAVVNCLARASLGSLDKWGETVAAPAIKSGPASAAILMSLAAPLLHWSSVREGFILNFAGDSSSGKTTANRVGASVWGDPDDILSWNATTRGLAELAAAHNDICLVLDDAEQADENPKKRLTKVNDVTHVLTSGKGKTYARMMGDRLPGLSFRCLVLSSSPKSIESETKTAGRDRTNGDRVRLLELSVPPGKMGGIFLSYDGSATPQDTASLSDALSSAAKSQFGVVGRSWAAHLVRHQETLPKTVGEHIGAFRKSSAPFATGPHRRVADKIGLLYAAGRLAISAGILPWSEEQLAVVTRYVYEAVIESAWGNIFNPVLAVRALRRCLTKVSIEVLSVARLSEAKPRDGVDGYIWKRKSRMYLRLEAFKRYVSLGSRQLTRQEYEEVVTFLTHHGALLRGGAATTLTRDIRIGSQKEKYLVFNSRKLRALTMTERPSKRSS